MATIVPASSIIKLNGENWPTWKFETKIILNSQGLFGIVSGESIKPKDTEKEQKATWMQNDAKAQSIIVTRMEQGPQTHILSCETAFEMWTKLKAVYDKESAVSIHLLQQKFFTMEFEDSVSNFLSKIEDIRVKLKQAKDEISDKMTITKILMSLPDQYKHFRSAWESAPVDKQTLEELTSRLLLEEERCKSFTDDTPSASALVSRTNVNCLTCGKSGHLKKDCYSNKKCDYCKKTGHASKYCFFKKKNKSKKSENNKVTALVASEIEQSTDCWYMDSGCTHHMCKDQAYFENYKQLDYVRMVQMGDGAKVRAIGQGNIVMKAFDGYRWSLVNLENVLLVPNLKVNLFSVSSALDKGLKMISNSTECRFSKNSNTIVIAKRTGNLYQMCFRRCEQALSSIGIAQGSSNSEVSNKNVKVVSSHYCNNECELYKYHCIFGHQNFTYVKNVLKINNILCLCTKEHFCTACVQGKQCRKPHPSSSTKTCSPGEIICADLCGPMEEKTLGGSRYFLLLKDDYSHFRTIYLLKEKNQVHTKLRIFLALCKNQGIHVKTLRTDGGGEFVNKSVKDMLEKQGIIHQVTVAYTPAQNGKIEREMRTVVEAAKSMLKEKNLQKNLWGEAVNTAVYIINRTGTSSVDKMTPYELWYNKSFDISNLKTSFGTEVWTHVPKQRRLKLDSKSRKGLFVGYGEQTKGYKIYYPENNTFSMEREVLLVPQVLSKQTENIASENLRLDENKIPENYGRIIPITESITQKSQGNTVEEQEAEQQDNQEIEESIPQDTERRPQRQIKLPKRYDDYETFFCFLTIDPDEPATLKEAKSSHDSVQWEQAMKVEMAALAENDTWSLVKKPETHFTIIDTKWVYKIKRNKDVWISRSLATWRREIGETTLGAVRSRSGYAVWAERGRAGKICAAPYDGDKHALSSVATSLCKALSYKAAIHAEATMDVEAESDEQSPNKTREQAEYVEIVDPFAQEISFVKSDCPQRKVIKVVCDNLECGIPTARGSRATSGVEGLPRSALPGDWPWYAVLLRSHVHACDASLVHPAWLITTASCFQGQPKAEWTARLGTVRTQSTTPWQQERRIVGMVRSPVEGSMLALVRLEEPVEISDFVRPACLPGDGVSDSDHSICNTLGWTRNRDQLQRIHVNTSPMNNCENVSIATVNGICAEPLYDQDDCDEEEYAGSSMMCFDDKTRVWSLMGVSGWRIACTKIGLGRPRIYDAISSHIDWIKRTISNSAR